MHKYDLEEMYEFLDDLRDLGVINMFAAPAYLQEAYPMSVKEATDVVRNWMDTYQARHGGHFNTVSLEEILDAMPKEAEDNDGQDT